MVPVPNGQTPAMARNSVDLPEPDGPVTKTRSAGWIVKASAATRGVPFGSFTSSCFERDRRRAAGWCQADGRLMRRRVCGRGHRHLEAVETGDDRAPFRQRPVGHHEERQRTLDAREGRCRLHHVAELDLLGEEGRRHQHVGKDHGSLLIARRERGEALGPAHDGVPVADHEAEATEETAAFGALALEQRDLLGILADADEVEAEVGLIALLLEIEIDQRRADPVRQRGAEDRVDQRAPAPDSRGS